jgi:hypothetical protein
VPSYPVGTAVVAAVGEDGDVDRAGGWPGRAGDETGDGESATDAAVAGEAPGEMEERIDVALGRVWQEQDVDAVIGVVHHDCIVSVGNN